MCARTRFHGYACFHTHAHAFSYTQIRVYADARTIICWRIRKHSVVHAHVHIRAYKIAHKFAQLHVHSRAHTHYGCTVGPFTIRLSGYQSYFQTMQYPAGY